MRRNCSGNLSNFSNFFSILLRKGFFSSRKSIEIDYVAKISVPSNLFYPANFRTILYFIEFFTILLSTID